MVITHARSKNATTLLVRTAAIAGFAALTGLGARISFSLPFTPIPFTLQVLFVLLAGLVLGSRDGAISQLAYLAAITAGLPLDARAIGPAVWMMPTAGYLAGFVAMAFVTGWIAEHLANLRTAGLILACLAGIAALYMLGAAWLTIFFLHGNVMNGLLLGVAPFLVVDSIKAAIATLLTGGSRSALRRFFGG